MKAVSKRAWASGFACGLAAAGLVAGLGGLGESPARARGARFDRETFEQALDAVLERYVEPVDDSVLLTRALKGIVGGLDGHSHFLTADERKALRDQPKDGATGLTVHLHTIPGGGDRVLEVVGVRPGSPAAKAGLAPGDHVLEVGDADVGRVLSQIEAEARLTGEVGDVVALRVQRRDAAEPERIDLRLVATARDRLQGELLAVTNAGGRPARVARLRVRVFRRGVGDGVKRELARLRRAAGPDGLAAIILDLRGNPGGEVDEALVVADLFVADGILTRTRGRGGRILREERAHEAGTDTSTPLVVLQDRHSASAAELLTAALRDNGRAQSIGERSYGKGTVQEIMGMPDGSVLKLTIARYFSPSDQVIDGVGLDPDVPLSASQRARAVDEALRVLGLTRAE